MDSLPAVELPISRRNTLNRHLKPDDALIWLEKGWHDFKSGDMNASLIYGVFVYIVSLSLVGGLFLLKADYAFFPALGAFLVMGPALAMGLYENSRRLANGEPVNLDSMIRVETRSPHQMFYIGLILLLLCLLWMRAAVLIYALFFGMHQFPGFTELLRLLLLTPDGWGLLFVGSVFGALFAAMGFAISALSVPMLLNEKTDAFTAMGASMTLIWHNAPVMLGWGIIVFALFLASVLTGFIGLIVIFPVLGHATWHAYVAIRGDQHIPVVTPAIAEPAS